MLSQSVRDDYNYKLSMIWIEKVKQKTNTNLGSVRLGVLQANFYFDKIEEMLSPEHVNLQLLEELSLKIKKDYEFVIKDCTERINPERDDVHDNKIMMSVISDFLLTLSNFLKF